jgi:hypothetical protein
MLGRLSYLRRFSFAKHPAVLPSRVVPAHVEVEGFGNGRAGILRDVDENVSVANVRQAKSTRSVCSKQSLIQPSENALR